MRHTKHVLATFFKTFLSVAIGLLTWTLSIQMVPVTLDAQPVKLTHCDATHTTNHVFQSMTDGIVTHMHNDGALLSIGIGTGWKTLSHESRQQLYLSLQCLAKQEQVAFHILPTHQADTVHNGATLSTLAQQHR